MIFFSLVISFIIMVIILLLINLRETGKHTSFIKKRIFKAVASESVTSPADNSRSPLTEVLSKKIDQLTKKFVPKNIINNIEIKITTAAIKNFNVANYFLLKLLIIFFILVLFPIYFVLLKIQINQGLIVIFLIVGFWLPDLMLNSQIEKRHKTILKDLPNFIDLLRICIEAGLDLESSLNKIVDKSKGILREETAQAVTEIHMGKSIAEALQDMAKRINFPDFSSFVTLLIQANQMGISISNVLRTQAQLVKLKYMQKLRARAAKTPVMIIVPLVFFILPALMIIIMGPIFINLRQAFSAF